jgi:hypothetical protein
MEKKTAGLGLTYDLLDKWLWQMRKANKLEEVMHERVRLVLFQQYEDVYVQKIHYVQECEVV